MNDAVSGVLTNVLLAVLPLISLLSGILSLYVDPQKESKKKWLFVTILVLSALATIGISVHDDKMHTKESDALKIALNSLNLSSNAVKSDLNVVVNCLAQQFGIKDIRSRFSGDAAITSLKVSIDANQQMNLLVPKLPALTVKPLVLYYAKDVDAEVVKTALQRANLDVKIKKALDVKPTNVFWIGDKISPDAAHFVALTLVRAGVGLNKILRFHDGSGPKCNLIEIGAYEEYRSPTTLSIDDILSMSDFPRDPMPAPTYPIEGAPTRCLLD